MNEFQLFKCKYDELLTLCNNDNNKYNLLKASSIIRDFLIDDNPLVDQVNRSIKHKIIFKVEDTDFVRQSSIIEELLGATTVLLFNAVDPNEEDKKLISELNRDAFLAMPILYNEGKEYSVRQIIKVCANVFGGRHYDLKSKKDPDYPALVELNNQLQYKISILDFNVVSTLASIGRVVIASLAPIREKIS